MKILFIRFSSIGDIVLTTPVIRCVKHQIDGVQIHYVIKKSFAAVIQHNPYIDKRFYYDDNLTELITELKTENYDAVIDLQNNMRSLKIKTALGKKNYSFHKLNFKKWLLVNFKINLLPDVHITDRYLKAVAPLHVINDDAGLDYFISDEDDRVIEKLPEVFKGKYLAWVIGAKHATKRLPVEKMISIAKKLNHPVILLGDSEDEATGKILQEISPEKIFNACGKFSLNESAALVKHASLVITHDTGLMHIAAAFKKKIISVWGNTIPAFGMYPYYGGNTQSTQGSAMLQVHGLSCRPCSKIGFEKCPKSHFRCMREIDETIFSGL